MTGNQDAQDAFGGKATDATSAFGGAAPRPAAPAPPVAVRPTQQPPMQAFSDLGQTQAPMTAPDTSLDRETPSDAIVALGLSLAGVFLFPIVPSIFALVFARRAKRAIAAEPGRLGGQGYVTAATVIAWVTIVSWIVFIAIWVTVVAAGFNLV